MAQWRIFEEAGSAAQLGSLLRGGPGVFAWTAPYQYGPTVHMTKTVSGSYTADLFWDGKAIDFITATGFGRGTSTNPKSTARPANRGS